MLLYQGVWLLLLSSCSGIEFTDEMITKYREKVRAMFYHAYNGYLNHAYPLDELKPITCTGHDTWGSFSLSLVDALDTLIIMGNTTEFRRAVDLVLKSVKTDANVNVSVFETNIRIVGGLVSAHMLSGRVEGMQLEDGWPCSGPLLRLAKAMAARLLPAFNTETGMPYGTVNLKYGVPKSETPVTCTAGVGTFIVEFGTLSRLTGDPQFERVALRALESLWRTRSAIGLVGNHINVQTGQWTATDTGIGAGVDSYFEYLVKGAFLLQRPALMEQFNEYASAINRYVRKGDWFMWVSMAKGAVSLPIFQSLEAFWPGLLTMIGDVEDASRIMLQYSQVIRQYGFPPEFYNIQSSTSEKRSAFPLRPEMAESLMYLYRATEDPKFLELAAQLVDAIEHSAKTSCGYATINNVNDHSIEDRMESFFLAETTKYLYLIFDHQNFIHNDGRKARIVDTPNGECVIDAGGYIFNTEAHPIDPAIVHCCSAQRQAEREAVRKWEDEYDLLSILDHHDTISPKLLRKETLPEFLTGLKGIREDLTYLQKPNPQERLPSEIVEIEYEIDESFIDMGEAPDGEKEKEKPPPSSEEAQEMNALRFERDPVDFFNMVMRKDPLIRKGPVGPPFAPPISGKTISLRAQPSSPLNISDEQIIEKVRGMIHRARLEDEQKREKGEETNSVELLIAAMTKIYSEHSDLIMQAKEIDDELFEEMQQRAENERLASLVPVATAFCEKCCYPTEEIGESVSYRYWMDSIYRSRIYTNRGLKRELGPLCWEYEAPKVEDNYRNVAPNVSLAAVIPGDVPVELFFHPPSLTNFEIADIEFFGFSLLSSPPVSFGYKFAGMGQVTLPTNVSWYFH